MTEFQDGYCKGFMDAMAIIDQNRSHFRQLLGLPERSQADVLREIYVRRGNASDQPGIESIVDRTVAIIAESVDLYLVPGITGCVSHSDGTFVYLREASL